MTRGTAGGTHQTPAAATNSGGGTNPAAAAAAANPTPAAQGDTSHCKGDRQFDPAIDFYAPPCVGKSNGQNPGDTYQGVSGDEIKIVQYVGAGDPAVNAILAAQGALRRTAPVRRLQRVRSRVHQPELRAVRPQGRHQDLPGHVQDDPAGRELPPG